MGQTITTSPRNQLSCPGPNNLPPLTFHAVHGDNIRISRDGHTARRVESFCKGVTFSARPLRVNERVCVRFTEISTNWSGVIRFGFTSVDPASMRYNLPKYACPDLTNKPGFWAKALHERYCVRNNVLFYYVNASGDVHFGINGEEKGVFMTDVDARAPLWAVIDVYGNSTVIEFLDSRIYAFQQQQQQQQQQQPRHMHPHHPHHHHQRSISAQSVASPIEPNHEPNQIIAAMDALSIHSGNSSNSEAPIQIPPLRFTPASVVVPAPFHCTRGRNIKFLSAERNIALRNESEFCQGYVFTSRPIKIGEKFIIQILKTENMYVGSMALGLTSCDPALLQPHCDLPDDSDLLLDRREYWVLSKDVADLQKYDEIKFCLMPNGELQISKNGGPSRVVMHVDQSLTLWAFLDVYGSTQSVSMYSEYMPAQPQRHIVQVPELSTSQPSIAASNANNCTNTRISLSTAAPSSDMIQLQTGGTVLVVNLPPAQHEGTRRTSQRISAAIPQQPNQELVSPQCAQYCETSLSTTTSNNAANYATLQTWQDNGCNANNNSGECIICYTKKIDSVLYSCGHMSMCYECAIKQWRMGTGHCPLCRAVIKDVIRTYKT
ncbi:protein neuralized [Culicoides brevitarsis]|uniref:protein neuralized n=1 Tax=Culicoides brevitarsis TaxID=469753 RepID=UPI00307C8E2D